MRTPRSHDCAECAEQGIGVIVYSPMRPGLLAGSWTAQRSAALGVDDWRAGSADFTGETLEHNLKLAEALGAVAARRPAQVDGWLPAATLELAVDDLRAVVSATEATGAGTGPSHP